MAVKIYVASTGQHKGKTTSTLGLVASLQTMGFQVGYCKPVGQKFLTVEGKIADKDAVLFAKMLKFKIIPEVHSPVILGPGATTRFLDNPSKYNYVDNILYAAKEIEKDSDVVVYEGTGHPGVGSVVNLSNAQVAKLLGASVIMVVEGGVGSTIDRLNMSMALFREEKVPIIGVIINKVKAEKIERIRFYLEPKLAEMGIPLLGLLPYDPTLSFPIISTICKAVKAKVHYFTDHLDNKVEQILAGSLIDTHEFTSLENILLVVSHKRFSEAIEKIQKISDDKKLKRCPLSGVLVTGDGRAENWYDGENLFDEYLQESKVPILTTSLDTYGSGVKISQIEVKINTHTPWKVKRAIELIRQNVDLEKLAKAD